MNDIIIPCTKNPKLVFIFNDTSLAIIAKTFEKLEMEVFWKKNLLLEWFKSNKLILNTNKTKFLLFAIFIN